MARARFVNGWAIPRTPNAQHNWGFLGDFRPDCPMSKTGIFDSNARSVLSEGHSIEEQVALCIAHGVAVIPTVTIHDPGDSTGTGYHGAGWAGRGPHVSVSAAGRYGRELAQYLKSTGVKVEAFSFGNELEYAPTVGDHDDYLDKCLDMALEFHREVHKVFRGIEIILGGNQGAATNNSRKTIAHAMLERSLQGHFTLDIHGNAESIDDFVKQIKWCKSGGIKVCSLEDRAPGSNNDALERCKAFSQAGATRVGQFASRNVDAEGDNPKCLWGVQLSGKATARPAQRGRAKATWTMNTSAC